MKSWCNLSMELKQWNFENRKEDKAVTVGVYPVIYINLKKKKKIYILSLIHI